MLVHIHLSARGICRFVAIAVPASWILDVFFAVKVAYGFIYRGCKCGRILAPAFFLGFTTQNSVFRHRIREPSREVRGGGVRWVDFGWGNRKEKMMEQKKMTKQLVSLLLAATMILGGAFALRVDADAAQKNYMKKLGVKWGIEEGKAYSFKHIWAGIGSKDFTWKISNAKSKNVKKGNKQLSFTLTYHIDFKPTPEEVSANVYSDYSQSTGHSGATFAYAIVDAASGLDLEGENSKKVVVKSSKKEGKQNQYYGLYGMEQSWDTVTFPSTIKYKVTVTYPKNYNDLCIGLSGSNVLAGQGSQADANFWDGKVPFGKTTFYKKGKTNSRWVMVSDLLDE